MISSEAIPATERNRTSEPTTLRFVLITSEADLAALAPAWSRLLERSDCNEPMLSPTWLLAWWDIYGRGTGRTLRVGAWFDGDELRGLALCQVRWLRYRGIVPFRRLELIGSDLEEKDGTGTEYLNLIAERGLETRLVEEFVAALQANRFGGWDELVFDAFDGHHARLGQFEDAFARHGYALEKIDAMPAPYVSLPATWQEYLKSLGKHKRLVVKSLSELEEWAGDRLQRHQATSPESLAQGQAILRQLNAERWQAAGLNGVFEAPRFARFHDRVMAEFLQAGALDLRWLTVAGEPIGVSYSVRWNDKVYFYQSGRKMDLPAKVRAGIVLSAEGIRSAIEAGLREYDFMGGAAQYKSQLSSASRPLLRLRVQKTLLREPVRKSLEWGIGKLRAARTFARSYRNRSTSAQAAPSPEPGPESPG